MSKAVLLSIKPDWCELIASGEKTGEVRKTKPKLNTPFKSYIYCTKERSADEILWTSGIIGKFSDKANGKVIGEYVCDKIDDIRVFENGNVQDFFFDNLSNTCLTYDKISEYIGRNGIGYNWHISNLKIYDRPKELGEFFYACNKPKGTDCSDCLDRRENKCKSITRPPQSWCYVAEVEDYDR